MKTYKMIILLLLGSLFISSCRMGLDDLASNEECDIIDFNFEKRVLIKEERIVRDADGNEIKYTVDRVEFTPDLKAVIDVNKDQNRVDIHVKTIADISNMAGYAVISPGARIEPVDGAPVLGVLGDFSATRKYKVTAANEIDSKIWEVNVARLEED
ncbi:MAG: hypothetical protein ABFD10_20780 [Prolixibacteraceae bacterium]